MPDHGRLAGPPTARMPTARTVLSAFVAAVAVVVSLHVGAPAAAACSCVAPMSMAEYATQPGTSVLTGTPGPLQARGVPIEVTRWFAGPGARTVVWLARDSFGDQSAACQRTPPAVGRELILVLWWPEDGSDPSGSICTPIEEVAGDAGRAMLADAFATFGPPQVPVATPGPEEGTTPLGALASLAPAFAALAGGTLLLAVVVAALVRATRRPDRPA